METATVSQLVIAAQRGEPGAFDSLVARFQDMAYASAYTALNDAHLAQDAAQEAFTEAFFSLDNLREPAAFPGWFRCIVFKQSDRLTRGKRLATIPLESAPALALTDLDPAQLVEERDMQDRVRLAVADLSERERVVTLLFYSTGYSLKEIAAYLEVPVTSVKKRLFDARQHLKESLLAAVHGFLHDQRQAALEGFPDKVRLLIAVREGNITAVKTLLDRQPLLVNMQAERDDHLAHRYHWISSGLTPIYEAAGHGNIEMVTLLLDYGATIATKSYDALKSAIHFNQPAIVALLLKRGADVEGRLRYGNTVSAATSRGAAPLSLATMKGNQQTVALLLAHGADVNTVGPSGRTALHWAALKGHLALVKMFLENGANPALQDELGRTPLAWAQARNHRPVVAILLPWWEGRSPPA